VTASSPPPDLPVKGHNAGYLTVFAALTAGPTLLRVFPADHLGPAVLKAWLAVPPGTELIPVGDIYPSNLAEFTNAGGAAAFGIGSALYKPGLATRDVAFCAKQFMAAWKTGKAAQKHLTHQPAADSPLITQGDFHEHH
jgi:2-keto-3-deoxy-6-phosphogluconate aldolase